MTANRFANSPATLRLHFRTLNFEADGPNLFDGLFASSPHAVWLDSPGASLSILCDGSGPFARTLFLNADALGTRDNAFRQAQELLDYYRVDIPADLPCDFALGLVGAFGYELKEHAASPDSPVVSDSLPDLALIYTDRAVVIDHVKQQTHILYFLPNGADSTAAEPPESATQKKWVRMAVETMKKDCAPVVERGTTTSITRGSHITHELLPAPNLAHPPATRTSSLTQEHRAPTFLLDQSKSEYLESIQRCLDYIAAGDSYEVCLTNTAQGPSITALGFTPLSAYQSLRCTSPVPYGAYLQFTPAVENASGLSASDKPNEDTHAPFHILSASPEQFLKITDGHVSAQPIKGTRPRGLNEEEDRAWRRELKANPKDRAENLMIVDLLRNDLSRVCAVGSVRVPRIFAVETYSHVHQLVSTIEGDLAPGMTPLDCVAACFPGGSMTGAPKIRTMEIIAEQERRPRGFYSGAVGWISPNGCADLSIVIRTLVCTPNATTFGVGGAIVADSDPESEFEETMVKARALLEALGAEIDLH